jgi:hypothetical protein
MMLVKADQTTEACVLPTREDFELKAGRAGQAPSPALAPTG